MAAKVKIKDRIIAALREHGESGQMKYDELAKPVV